MDFGVEERFHETARKAVLTLSVETFPGRNAGISFRTRDYLSADSGPAGFMPYRRTDTHQLQGRLRITRTRVSGRGRVLESVSGSGSITADLRGDVHWRTFSFTAIRRADGTVDGQWERVNRFGGTAAETKSHGVITCFTIVGDEAWIGGYATSGSSSDGPNNAVGWHVKDNGQGQQDPPDQISWQGTWGTAEWAADYRAIASSNLLDAFDLEAGNIQIMKK